VYSANSCSLVVSYMASTFNTFSNDGTVSYKAQSQDEEALVNAASNLDMKLIRKDSSAAGSLVLVRL
jgi:magnesium-transporting ATPase (P-type)